MSFLNEEVLVGAYKVGLAGTVVGAFLDMFMSSTAIIYAINGIALALMIAAYVISKVKKIGFLCPLWICAGVFFVVSYLASMLIVSSRALNITAVLVSLAIALVFIAISEMKRKKREAAK